MRRYQTPKVRSGSCEEIPHVQGKEWSNHMGHSLPNSMKLSTVPCRAAQEGWVMVESSDKMWSTGEVSHKPLQYS